MSDSSETFFTSIGCMDGRALRPVRKFGKQKFGVWYVDTITEAGLVGQVARLQTPASPHAKQSEAARERSDGGQANGANPTLVEAIKKKLLISIEKHHSKGVIVHGHQDCAGNPVDDEKHKQDILKTAEIIRSFVPLEVPVVPAFIVKEEDWKVLPL